MSSFIGCGARYGGARAVIFGAPFDSTASYMPGSRFAPAALRNESGAIETYSPYLGRDLEDIGVHDMGDLELPPGDAEAMLRAVERRAAEILKDGKIPVMLGGEHLVTLGAVRAAYEKYPDLRIVHFDAHTDLRDEYLGAKMSHATVIRRCWDILGDGRIYQFGIRSGTREEFAWAGGGHTNLRRFDLKGAETLADALGGAPVYLTVDLDVLDPGVFPGTGTPEAGGVSYAELRDALKAAARCDIVGADMVELSPPQDLSGVSTLTACTLLRELLLMAGASTDGSNELIK
ncbi:MAG: agmatinase [Oscillospiraceae bacterium]|nr:agmatinase [Oscillospiraceae bacterium]